MFYPQVIHISGITYVNGVFKGFPESLILLFFVEKNNRYIYKEETHANYIL